PAGSLDGASSCLKPNLLGCSGFLAMDIDKKREDGAWSDPDGRCSGMTSARFWFRTVFQNPRSDSATARRESLPRKKGVYIETQILSFACRDRRHAAGSCHGIGTEWHRIGLLDQARHQNRQRRGALRRGFLRRAPVAAVWGHGESHPSHERDVIAPYAAPAA